MVVSSRSMSCREVLQLGLCLEHLLSWASPVRLVQSSSITPEKTGSDTMSRFMLSVSDSVPWLPSAQISQLHYSTFLYQNKSLNYVFVSKLAWFWHPEKWTWLLTCLAQDFTGRERNRKRKKVSGLSWIILDYPGSCKVSYKAMSGVHLLWT